MINNQRTENTPENTKLEMENVRISIDMNCEVEKDNIEKRVKMRIEKSCLMASALFHLIELSCMQYEELRLGEADPKLAQEHIESIRITAELGKQLAYQI